MEKRIKGNVFDIQRYSIHDGPGIRTVVFLKGCPLRCKWCSNPESWNESPQLFYAASRCIGCRTCVTVCTNKEVTPEDRGVKIHWDRCKADKLDWVEQCPTKALTVKGKWMEISKVMSEIEKDIDFYRQSKGGITLSGGEPLLQPEFSYELLRLCNEKGIHTSVETTGCVPKENLEKILPVVDLFLYDIKLADTHKHKEWTGIGNEEILENLRWISKQSKKIFVRTPMIPEVNDKEQNILDISRNPAEI